MTRRSSGFALVLALLLLPGLSSCGYHLLGQGAGVIPEHVRVIVIVPFENRTQRPEIEQRVTEGLAREMSRRGRYRIVTSRSEADAMLAGAITGYRTVPVEFSDAGRATRVEAIVTIESTLRDLRDDEVLWGQAGLVFREQFEVEEGEQFFDQETLALELIARSVSSAMVTSIVEGF